MTAEYERVELTPKQAPPAPRHTSYTINRPDSPLKQEVFTTSLDLEFEEQEYHHIYPPTSMRSSRAFDQTHRWTVLAREAEADEVSILSVTSEEKGYYTSLPPDVVGSDTVNAVVDGDRPRSVISGFSQDAFVEHEHEEDRHQNVRETSVERFSEIDYDEAIQFSALPQITPFLALSTTEPPP